MLKTSAPAALVHSRQLFTRPDAHPVALDVLLLSTFGPSWLSWEPETLWVEIDRTFGVTISARNRNRVNAVKTLHLVSTPWEEWNVFTVTASGLNGDIPDFRMLIKPTVPQIFSAVTIMNQVRDLEFSEEVGRYIAACFLDDGIYLLPDPVSFAQEYASRLQYRCRKCGKIDVDDSNNMCDSCGAPQSELVKEPVFNPQPVLNRYNDVLRQGYDREDYLEETEIDIQVAKLLAAFDYAQQMTEGLRRQLEELHDADR